MHIGQQRALNSEMRYSLHSQGNQRIIDRHLNPRHFISNFLFAILISALIAVFLFFAGIGDSFLLVLIISEAFGISTYSLIHLLFWLLKPEKITSIISILIIGVAGGTMLGLHLGPFILRQFFSVNLEWTSRDLLQAILFAIAFGGAISYFFFSKARLRLTREEIQQERIRRLSKEKEALEANLKLLQAQIEPHFLFNTLSNILSLIDTSPDQGKAMLLDSIQYLRTSLSRTRHDLITLNQEIEIIQAYLNILKIRMGERLRFRIEIPDTLREQPFPPMLLQPLVENAVKHGLEPQIQGGEILIRIEEKDGLVRSEIIDTGIGFTSHSEAGVGMINVRERLRLLYGERGRLVIEENKPRGVKAVIEVPKGGGDQHGL
jgi:sensor histidine kinase YesM